MAYNEYAKLRSLREQVAALEARLTRENRKLLALPAKHGFRSMDAFIDALRAAAGSATGTNIPAMVVNRRKRAKITPDIKAKVRAMVEAEKSGAEIAQALEISLPSVQNIKNELGLVKKRI